MGRATVMIPPSTTLMLMVTCMLSVQIASVQNGSTDVTTVSSSYNTSESLGTNDTTVSSSYNSSESPGINDTTETSSDNGSESTGANDTTETSSYNGSESTGANDTTGTSSYNGSESTGANDTTGTSSYNGSESTGANDTTGTSSYNGSESTGANDTTGTSSYNGSESTGANDTTGTSSNNGSESTGANDTTLTSTNNASESSGINDTTETSSYNGSESTGANDTTGTSSYNASESSGINDTTVTSSYNGSESTGANDTTGISSYNAAEMTSTDDSTVDSANTTGHFDNTTQTSDNSSTDDTVTPTDNTGFTNITTDPEESATTASPSSSTQTTTTTASTTTTPTTTTTTPTTTATPINGSCTPGSRECASNFVCDNTSKCVCQSDQYYNSSTNICLKQKNPGETCGTEQECINNLICVSSTCNCSEGFYYDTTSRFCKLKLDHAVECQSSDQCKVTHTVCITYLPSSTTKCLCDSGFYWTDKGSCISKNNLNITATVADRTTRTITFNWTDVSQRTDVRYNITWGVSNNMEANKTGVTVVGLNSATSYSFFVVTSLPADGNYSLIEVHQPQTAVWTRPETPSAVTRVQRVDNSTYAVTFGQSSGGENRYTMDVSLEGNFIETQSNTSTVLYFTKLQPAKTYDYSLRSLNGISEASVPVTGQFTTDPEASGPVDGLNATGVQSHTANVTWMTPLHTGGTIIGYLVEVSLQDSKNCLYYFKICENCSQLPTNIPVPSCNVTDAKITVSDKYNLELPNLKPYQNYTVEVWAVNEIGRGEPTHLTFQTSTSVPNDITDLKVESVRNESSRKVDLMITWTPGEQTGPTNYYISVQGVNDDQSISPINVTVTGYNNNSHVIYDVLAYWNYNVSVVAQTDKGNSNEKFALNRTVENNPGPVKNLTVTQDSTVANILILTFECPEIRSHNGTIEMFMITQTLLNAQGEEEKEKQYNESASVGERCKSVYEFKVPSIIVERNYSFTVTTVNNKYAGESKTVPNFYVPSKAPLPAMVKAWLGIDSLVKQKESSNEQTKINAEVCSTCLNDIRWGPVVNVGLIVCVKGSINCTETGRKKRSTGPDFTQFPTWAAAKQRGFKVPYRTTPDKWMPPVPGMGHYSQFVVGENTSCADANAADYCNGPLLAGQEFYISVIMCTKAGCTIDRENDIFKTSASPDKPSQVGAIVGGVLGGLALVAVIGVIIFLVMHYRKRTPNHSRPPIENKTECKEIIKKRPVRMRDFNDHVTRFHKDSNLLFQDEFENIRNTSETFNNTCDEAKREQNRVKNRWADILPYDHSRVKLNISSDDDDTNDFINANYIPGYSSVREYIATQGPLYSTIPDFWKMIWEQKTKVIVMLSDLTESGKNGIPQRKVDLYWPENLNEPIGYGTVVVEMTNFSQLNNYIIRNFRLIKGDETRKVTHFFLPGWPDYSADVSFDAVLGFVKAVRQEITPDSQGPIVVHCSAGVGRSGTFIALDYFSQFVEQHSMDDSIDIFEFVLRMRKNRTRMVQVETQYIFIYDGINKLIQSKIKSEEEKLYENVNPANGVYENLKQQEENIYANTTVKDDKYVYNNEAFEPDFAHSQKSDKPTTEL